jgi:hypothetical protein
MSAGIQSAKEKRGKALLWKAKSCGKMGPEFDFLLNSWLNSRVVPSIPGLLWVHAAAVKIQIRSTKRFNKKICYYPPKCVWELFLIFFKKKERIKNYPAGSIGEGLLFLVLARLHEMPNIFLAFFTSISCFLHLIFTIELKNVSQSKRVVILFVCQSVITAL